jgi:hypothetical protein
MVTFGTTAGLRIVDAVQAKATYNTTCNEITSFAYNPSNAILCGTGLSPTQETTGGYVAPTSSNESKVNRGLASVVISDAVASLSQQCIADPRCVIRQLEQAKGPDVQILSKAPNLNAQALSVVGAMSAETQSACVDAALKGDIGGFLDAMGVPKNDLLASVVDQMNANPAGMAKMRSQMGISSAAAGGGRSLNKGSQVGAAATSVVPGIAPNGQAGPETDPVFHPDSKDSLFSIVSQRLQHL